MLTTKEQTRHLDRPRRCALWGSSATKQAANQRGYDSDTSFEQVFSSLARSYLRDKAPGLLDYEVGFQLLERNEDNTRAVAVMGFKVGPSWMYAPVFFLNGNFEGHELLFLKNQGMFRHVLNAGRVLGGLPAFTKVPNLRERVRKEPPPTGGFATGCTAIPKEPVQIRLV